MWGLKTLSYQLAEVPESTKRRFSRSLPLPLAPTPAYLGRFQYLMHYSQIPFPQLKSGILGTTPSPNRDNASAVIQLCQCLRPDSLRRMLTVPACWYYLLPRFGESAAFRVRPPAYLSTVHDGRHHRAPGGTAETLGAISQTFAGLVGVTGASSLADAIYCRWDLVLSPLHNHSQPSTPNLAKSASSASTSTSSSTLTSPSTPS